MWQSALKLLDKKETCRKENNMRRKLSKVYSHLKGKRIAAEAHFVAVMLAMALVCVIGVFIAGKQETWFSTQQTTFETRTNGIFDNI